MAHREFTDVQNRHWEVWDVFPPDIDRRLSGRVDDALGDRTPSRASRFDLPAELRSGWLAFQCGVEVRRLAPIPANWETVSDRDLERLGSSAKVVRPRPEGEANGSARA
jgi:hypothetical protein